MTGCFGWRSCGSVARSDPRLKSSFCRRVRSASRRARSSSEAPRRLAVRRAHEAEDRVQLVDRPVALDADGVLGDARAAHEARLALVASPRVDAIDPDRHAPSRTRDYTPGSPMRASRSNFRTTTDYHVHTAPLRARGRRDAGLRRGGAGPRPLGNRVHGPRAPLLPARATTPTPAIAMTRAELPGYVDGGRGPARGVRGADRRPPRPRGRLRRGPRGRARGDPRAPTTGTSSSGASTG